MNCINSDNKYMYRYATTPISLAVSLATLSSGVGGGCHNSFRSSFISSFKTLIATSVPVELEKGDLLLFHSKLFHAAGRNLTDSTKYSMVFTYHEADNYPIAETRSSRFPSIRL